MTPTREWKIVIDPRSKDSPCESIVVCYMPVGADKESAEIDAAGYAELIELNGGVGSWAIDVASGGHVPGGVIKQVGKSTWLVRLDSFEHETKTGYDDGFGYLRVRELFS